MIREKIQDEAPPQKIKSDLTKYSNNKQKKHIKKRER